ncbi:TIGR03619 family F420-dependent LLM class oxidoreductase [Mycobacteroides abscessus]|uniref:TIGR03619 family F420-dependent LLM class oxidoreductase n=1 Tax=Mycobacteroides abscessus TaxID=36809 RepID=UPI00078D3AE3|nr:TIGR03619 family F420-dependent LLM class oxidoreductase [Mycobacteroides abscessus]AMU75773.1 LLM class F420-dependent oxidoreductase [Mycobacteroides abscessus]ANO24718.1 LLM class F420-dependent oxidoreductase [Mycobacteroides abscessus]
MDFGVSIPNYGACVSAGSLRAWASTAEKLGFSYAMVTDHIAQTPDVRRTYSEDFLESFTALTYIAALTSEIKIGTTVTVLALRNPINTAGIVASIDRLSGGRMILGVGVGGAAQEYAALGVPFTRRGAITDEYLEAIAALWRAGGPVGFDGKFTSFHDVLPTPHTAQEGGPEIWVGGSADAALRRAAQHSAWHPTFPDLDELLARKLPRLRTVAQTLHRPVPAVRPRIHLDIHKKPVERTARPIGIGSSEQIKEDLHRLQQAGIAGVIFDPVRHPGIHPDAPPSRTHAQDTRELDQIRTAADELINPVTGTIRP